MFFTRIKKIFNNKSFYRKYSYSQCGEDILIKYVFDLRGVHKPTYLDVGCNDPFALNNTALFYEAGARGINIDANPALIKKFDAERKNDINLNAGIGPEETELDFYVLSNHTLSTFSRQDAEFVVSLGKVSIKEIRKVKLLPLHKILEKYNNGIFTDLLTIDVEGLDFEILQSIDFEKTSPKVICAEAAEYSPIGAGSRRSELIDFLASKGYYEYANTNLNAIMVRKDFWFI